MGGSGVDSEGFNEGGVEELKEEVKLFRRETPAGTVTADANEFAKGAIYPNIGVENNELKVRVGDEYHSIVRAGKFNELVNEVGGRLVIDRAVVVIGPRDVGKSTLAATVIWELMSKHEVGLIARVNKLDEGNYSEFATFVEGYGEKFSKHLGRLLILYDPVFTKTYRKDVIEKTMKNLVNILISSEASKPLALIVLPSDVYNALSEEVKNALEVYRLDVSQGLINTELLAELIREYTRTKGNPSGCELSNDVLSKLASELVKFDSDHALIARLIGEELARSNCDVGKVEELINKAEGKVRAFIIQYINKLFKVDENPNTAKVLVEVFALRRPFVNKLRPGDPILAPGIVELIGEGRGVKTLYGAEGGELRGWLAIRQHDLIEEAVKRLLICIVNRSKECEELGDALMLWMGAYVPRSRSEADVVKYFFMKYGKRFLDKMREHRNCWRRTALIIGLALTGRVSVPRPEDLPESLRGNVAKSLGDALNRCEIDDYLLVDNKIPPLIWHLIKKYVYTLAGAFTDMYGETIDEVRRVLNIARDRGSIYDAEKFYGLGLASIIANAAGSNRPIEPGDADAALYMASIAIKDVSPPNIIIQILSTLRPLRDKAPHRYLKLLVSVSGMESLDLGTVEHVFNELNNVLDNYGDVVKGYTWSIIHAVTAYVNLLGKYLSYCSGEKKVVKNLVGRVIDLLNELSKFKSSPDVTYGGSVGH